MLLNALSSAVKTPGIANDVRPPVALVRKIGNHVRLAADERAALERILSRNVQLIANRTALVEEGAAPNEIHVLLSGWACRYALASDGKRRIVAFYLPGDICDFDVFLMTAIDQSIAAIGAVKVAALNRAAINELSQTQPKISSGLWWESAVAASIQRAWTINVGQRGAKQRIAHLLCELHTRLALVDLAEGDECDWPLTQPDIADACGLTAIHTNRALQEMRADRLVTLRDQRLRIENREALTELAQFDPGYLQVAPTKPRDVSAPGIIQAQSASIS